MTARASILVVALLAACGGGGSGGGTTGTQTAACDWTAIDTNQRCQQATGPAAEIQSGSADCAALGGVLRAICPATGGAGLVGCCSYPEFGLAMTWCYYDATLYATRAASCRALTIDVGGHLEPAVWTTTVPVP
jgi:hypothetical protein